MMKREGAQTMFSTSASAPPRPKQQRIHETAPSKIHHPRATRDSGQTYAVRARRPTATKTTTSGTPINQAMEVVAAGCCKMVFF